MKQLKRNQAQNADRVTCLTEINRSNPHPASSANLCARHTAPSIPATSLGKTGISGAASIRAGGGSCVHLGGTGGTQLGGCSAQEDNAVKIIPKSPERRRMQSQDTQSLDAIMIHPIWYRELRETERVQILIQFTIVAPNEIIVCSGRRSF